MLHILLLIIKWILILLGILAGLILLIILLLLFCPVRYKGKAVKERNAGIKEAEASGEVSWLFHGIAVKAFFRNGSTGMEFYILGIPLSKLKGLFQRKKKKSSAHTAEKKKKSEVPYGSRKHEDSRKDKQKQDVTIIKEPDEVPVETISADFEGADTKGDSKKEATEKVCEFQNEDNEDTDKTSETIMDETDGPEIERTSVDDKDVHRTSGAGVLSETENTFSETSAEEQQSRNKIVSVISEIAGKIKKAVLGILAAIRSFFGIPSKIFQKIQNFRLTIKKFCGKINWYKEFIDHPRTREALSLVWKDAKKLVRHVLPTRITGRITFGCEDPSVTGTVLAVLGMTIPFHKNAVAVTPLFDSENVLEGEVMLKGRIYGVMLLKTAAELYFNKNIKYVIRRWRHKEVNHGERE